MARSVAVLKGCILFIDGVVWDTECTPEEAAQIIADMADLPNAPTQVIFEPPALTVRQMQRRQVCS